MHRPHLLDSLAMDLYAFARGVVTSGGYPDDIARLQAISQRAVDLSHNNVVVYMPLMNEAMLGSRRRDPSKQFYAFTGIPDRSGDNLYPTCIGDAGFHPLYRDFTPNQANGHTWPFVNFGYQTFGWKSPWAQELAAWFGNILHEARDPGPSRQDYHASLLGAVIGSELWAGKLTPIEFTQRMRDIFGTDRYRQTLRSSWPQYSFKKVGPLDGLQNTLYNCEPCVIEAYHEAVIAELAKPKVFVSAGRTAPRLPTSPKQLLPRLQQPPFLPPRRQRIFHTARTQIS